MAGSLVDTLDIFSKLCGMEVMGNVIVATSMWGEVKEETGVKREQELKSLFLKDMVASGCAMARFRKTADSAWAITDVILKKGPCRTLNIQHETKHGQKTSETTAGQKAKATGFKAIVKKFIGLFSSN